MSSRAAYGGGQKMENSVLSKDGQGRKTFLRYVMPSVLSYALSGVYAIADGFFVGNSVGDIGLSTINIVYPVVTLMQALGTGIGMGGAVMWTVKRAEGHEKEAEGFLQNTLFSLFSASILMTGILFWALDPALRFLGAEGEIFTMGKIYLEIMIAGSVFQILATGIVPLIRNYGGASYAMKIMVAGFLTNIFLDYLFVWVMKGGMSGAAAATILGEAVTMVGALFYLCKKRMLHTKLHLKGAGKRLLKTAKIGIAPFGLTLSPMLSLLLMNRFSIVYGGEKAVACYACISYALTIVYLLMQGVGDGSQPLFSRYYGEGRKKELAETGRRAYLFAWFLAGICILFLWAFRDLVGPAFGSSPLVSRDVAEVLPIFLAGLIFYAFSRIATSYFYATEQSLFSYICVYAEPVFLFLLLLFVPHFGGQTGVWFSMVLSQIFTSAAALGLQVYNRRKRMSDE